MNSCPYNRIPHTENIHNFGQNWQVCSCSGFVPTSFISMQWDYNINWSCRSQTQTIFYFYSFFLSPCLSIYLFSLPAVQEQYLPLHLTLISLSSYSLLWASSLLASGCAPKACRNADKVGRSRQQLLPAQLWQCRARIAIFRRERQVSK